MSGQVYEYLGTGSSLANPPVWFDLTTNSEQVSGDGPGPTDIWLFTHDQDVIGYPIFSRPGEESFGTLLLAPNVNVTMYGITGDADSYAGLTTEKVIVGPGAHFTMNGGLGGNELIIGPGATANLNKIPGPGPGGGPGSDFANLINSGTLSVGPQTANGGFATSLTLGGPGFVQTTGFTSGESEVNDGAGHTVVSLGNIAQGTVLDAINEAITNAPVGGGFNFLLPGPHFTSFNIDTGSQQVPLGPEQATATVTVNTAVLGSHVALLSYTAGGVHDTLVITDKIVAA